MYTPALGLIRWMGGQDAERLAATQENAVVGLANRLVRQIRTYGRYRRALWELSQLDDRDLDDLALGRADLPGLAWQHARTTC